MYEAKQTFFGVSESFNHALEWRSKHEGGIKKDVCPALRATDYKCPKYAWFLIEEKDDTTKETL